MAALLLAHSCAVPIHDRTFCAMIPGDEGATCDGFLSPDQKILTESEWEDRQAKWLSQGQAVVCTTSGAVADIKEEIEQLCSRTHCSYPGGTK